ncbi:MAG: sigma 54-interacting transcriptional regulator [Planctomycetota bacterium]|nr:sigma 54-interacting transcriptional regulator [Planctomycetota bacterium]MDA1178552.1 sigma 54-interacting transcriptional regulator [Planctomycetota bacterium]
MKESNHYYLAVTAGARAGTNFVLDAQTSTLKIGRGTDCEIILMDPVCSRVHAEVFLHEGGWWLRDAGSRNGTYVNGQKIDEVQLGVGHQIKMGSTVFGFHRSDDPPGQDPQHDTRVTQSIIREAALLPAEESSSDDAVPARPDQAPEDLQHLYQLSLQLMALREPDQVIDEALQVLRRQVGASVVGFLWLTDQGSLKPKLILPTDTTEPILLSESLTQVVCQQGHAVWIANQSASDSAASLRRFADAICVPLVHERRTMGAVHVYRKDGRFRQPDFEFSIAFANLVVVALVRTREQAVLLADHERLKKSSGASDEILGQSQAIQELRIKIEKVAVAAGSVLVRGESGSGKELVARALHRAGPRADRPLLSVNCAAIPANLVESQLFGHRKGAFTGADRDHVGWFQQADSGTLFLDEIGELSLEGQAKLLRILEGHPFLPVGATQEVHVDVRVIAATNRDLRDYVKTKKFREDLYFRIAVFELLVPSLRHRGQDIDLLADHFLDQFRRRHGRIGLLLGSAAREKLNSYRWPGNVRQLRNVLDCAVVMADGTEIVPSDLGMNDATDDSEMSSLNIGEWELKLVREAMHRADGNVPEAAKLLGIGRATLYRKLEEYNIHR